MSDSESTFRRWSRRKIEARRSVKAPCARSDTACPTEADVLDIDFDALDFNSDYTQFVLPGAPVGVRHRALRKLWASNAVFTTPDGLLDYAQDFSDVAVNQGRPVRSEYCIGRGFTTEAKACAAQCETPTDERTTEHILPSGPRHSEPATKASSAACGQAQNASTHSGLKSDDLSRPNATGSSRKPNARG